MDETLSTVDSNTSRVDNAINNRTVSVATIAAVSVPCRKSLTEEQRQLLARSPVVENDADWDNLNRELMESGKQGAFYDVLVKTIKERLINKTDVHKTANGTLRALFSEKFVADHVTMAGYKKCMKIIFFQQLHNSILLQIRKNYL
jgi:PDZ domain-containing secreted protein